MGYILLGYLIIGVIWANTAVLVYKVETPEKYEEYPFLVRVSVYVQTMLLWPRDIIKAIIGTIRRLKEMKKDGRL